MATPLNLEPFDLDMIGPTRICPGCGVEKDTTPLLWTGRYVEKTVEDILGNLTILKVRVPTTYCRECVNTNKRNHRLSRKIIASAPDAATRAAWSAMVTGPCEICGPRAKSRGVLARFGERWVVCSQCRGLVMEAERTGDPLAHARVQSAIMSRHCLDETRIVNETRRRTNLDRVPYHKYNPEAKYSTYSHLVCLSLELSWRKIRQWLEVHQSVDDATTATVTTS